jgi:hypothetical protein
MVFSPRRRAHFTRANDHRFWGLPKNLRASAAEGPFWVAWVVSSRLPAPLGRPGPQRHPNGTPRTRSGSSGVVSWKSPGPVREASRTPEGTPKSLQGRGQYEANDPKLKQTRASHWNCTTLYHQAYGPQESKRNTRSENTSFDLLRQKVNEVQSECI